MAQLRSKIQKRARREPHLDSGCAGPDWRGVQLCIRARLCPAATLLAIPASGLAELAAHRGGPATFGRVVSPHRASRVVLCAMVPLGLGIGGDFLVVSHVVT